MTNDKPVEKINTVAKAEKLNDKGLDTQTVNKDQIAEGLKIVLNFQPTDIGPNLFAKNEKGKRHVKVSYEGADAELIEKLITKLAPLKVEFTRGTSSIQREISGFDKKSTHMHMGLLTLEFDIDQSQRKETRALMAEFINEVAKDDPIKWSAISAIQNRSQGRED